MINMQLIEKILGRDEGRRLIPYQDDKGIWTVGVGHNLEVNGLPHYIFPSCPDSTFPGCLKWLQDRGGLTEAEEDAMFDDDIKATLAFLSIYDWFETLDENRSAAIVDMCFNLGNHGYAAFTTFNRLMKAKRYQDAANDLKTTKVYTELHVRYSRIVEIIATGQFV